MADIQDKIQSLMTEVYNEWQKDENRGKDKWDVLDNFSEAHKIAVTFGNFNYQVENGGISQWIYNGYFHDDAEKLTEYLESGAGLDERCQKILDTIYKLDQYAQETGCDRDGYYIDPDDEDSESQFIGDMINCDAFDTWYYENCGGDDWWVTVSGVIEKVTGHEFDVISSENIPLNPIEGEEIVTLREFLDKRRGASIDAMTQGGYLYLTGEQTQNFESLTVVTSHLGMRGSEETRPLDDGLLNGVVQVRNFYEEANEYAIIVDEIEGARLIAQERSEAEVSGKEHSAYEPRQGDGDVGLEGYAADKDTPIHLFNVYIENIHNRNIGGFTIPLPTSPADIRPFLDSTEIVDWRDMLISDAFAPDGSDLWPLTNKLSDMVYATEMTPHKLNELNYLAVRVEGLDGYEQEIFLANIEADRNCGSIAEMINLTFSDNINKFDVQPAFSPEMYGEFLVEQLYQDVHADAFDRLKDSDNEQNKDLAAYIEKLEQHADLKKVGLTAAKEENGVFTKQGYLRGGDEGLLEIYRSPEDIPQEHIIMHEYPEELRYLTKHIPPDADRAELEYLAAKIQNMDAEQMKVFEAVVEAGMHCGSVAEIINTTENLDCFNLRFVSGEEEYGMRRLEQDYDDASAALQRLEKSADPADRALVKHIMILSRAVDDGMYGHHAAKEEGGIFTNQGLLTLEATPHIVYLGTQDLPAYRSSQPITDIPNERATDRTAADKSSPDAKPSVLAQIAEHRETQRREPQQPRDTSTPDKKKSDPEL